MTAAVAAKLLGLLATVALGWLVGRMRWLGGDDPARVLGHAALYLFIPALLFRTTVRVDVARLPWDLLAGFFVPAVALVLAIYGWQRWRNRKRRLPPAGPAVRAISAGFGNTVQVGVPMATALFGEAGLALHVTLVSVHALILLTVLTALAELDLAHERARESGRTSLVSTLAATVRATVIHPVVLPVLCGLLWNAASLPLPAVADEVLMTLGSAVVPLCLVLIGMSLAYHGFGGRLRGALAICVLKLVALPALVLPVAHWGFGLSGLPLAVVVMAAALPTGSNALVFAQRYRTLEPEVTAATVFSTLGFVATAPLWLALLAALGR